MISLFFMAVGFGLGLVLGVYWSASDPTQPVVTSTPAAAPVEGRCSYCGAPGAAATPSADVVLCGIAGCEGRIKPPCKAASCAAHCYRYCPVGGYACK